jgi:ketosteroid isomerase-like protein
VPVPRHLIALVVVTALAAAGCGRESEEENVRATLQEFADATARKDYQALCDDIFATKLVEEVKRSFPCELALKRSSLGEAQKPKLEVRRVRVDGEKASADVTTSAANQPSSRDTVQLVQEEGEWRIIALSSSS